MEDLHVGGVENIKVFGGEEDVGGSGGVSVEECISNFVQI